jgi:hypothetical protein
MSTSILPKWILLEKLTFYPLDKKFHKFVMPEGWITFYRYHQIAFFLSHPNLPSVSHPISLRSTLILQSVWIFVIKEVSSHLMVVRKLYRYFSSLLFQSHLRVVLYIKNTNCKTPQTTISSLCPSLLPSGTQVSFSYVQIIALCMNFWKVYVNCYTEIPYIDTLRITVTLYDSPSNVLPYISVHSYSPE